MNTAELNYYLSNVKMDIRKYQTLTKHIQELGAKIEPVRAALMEYAPRDMLDTFYIWADAFSQDDEAAVADAGEAFVKSIDMLLQSMPSSEIEITKMITHLQYRLRDSIDDSDSLIMQVAEKFSISYDGLHGIICLGPLGCVYVDSYAPEWTASMLQQIGNGCREAFQQRKQICWELDNQLDMMKNMLSKLPSDEGLIFITQTHSDDIL